MKKKVNRASARPG